MNNDDLHFIGKTSLDYNVTLISLQQDEIVLLVKDILITV